MVQWKFLHVKTLDSAVQCCCCACAKSNHQQPKVFFQPVKRYKADVSVQKRMKPKRHVGYLILFVFTTSVLTHSGATAVPSTENYIGLVIHIASQPNLVQVFTSSKKNAFIETIFFAALAIQSVYFCQSVCLFIIGWMLRTAYEDNDVKSITDAKWQVRHWSIRLYNQIDYSSICCLCNSIFLMN